MVATTVPVPGWPGFCAYPPFVLTITSWTVLPEIVEPDFEMELDTITAMKAGSGPAGGGGLFPGAVDQVTPQAGRLPGAFSKPLNEAGAAPPLRSFNFHHCAPQNVTAVPIAAFLSPITKVPP